MTGETMPTVTLQAHLAALLSEMDKRYEQRFAAQEQALQITAQGQNRLYVVIGLLIAALTLYVRTQGAG